jgi:uncharacterized protein YprB with RNaseH-like and TPR domain
MSLDKVKTQRKRLFFDIETSPNTCLSFQIGRKVFLTPESIINERAIICICYKWEDKKEVEFLHWDKKQSDKKILTEFIKIANEADEMIAHNGDKFDLAFIRTRCLFHKIEMFPDYVTIDTLKVSRSKFKFNSNKLDYISKFLGVGKKTKTDFNLWKDILLYNDTKSLDKMIKYCKNDVVILEKVWKEMRNHIKSKTHFGVVFGEDRGSCPECGSDQLVIHGHRFLASGTKKAVYQCRTCCKYTTKTIK